MEELEGQPQAKRTWAISEQASQQHHQGKAVDCRECLLSATTYSHNILNSAAFCLLNSGLFNRLSLPVAWTGSVALILLLTSSAALIARFSALQLKADFESSLTSVHTLADQSWMLSNDLEERINSLQRCEMPKSVFL